MLLLLAVTIDQTAMDFVKRAGLDPTGCRAEIKTIASRRMVDIKDNAAGGSTRVFSIYFDSSDRIVWAMNYSAVRNKPTDKKKPLLTESQQKQKIAEWVKRWPVPSGYTVRFTQLGQSDGKSTITYDRKVNGYWLNAPYAYTIGARTGSFERFSARYGKPGSTTVTVSKADAVKAAEAKLGPAIAKYGPHKVQSANIDFAPQPGSDLMHLSYHVRFFAPKAKNSYAGASIYINAATGKPVGDLVMLEMKKAAPRRLIMSLHETRYRKGLGPASE